MRWDEARGEWLTGMSCCVMYQSHYSYFPYQRSITQQDNKQVAIMAGPEMGYRQEMVHPSTHFVFVGTQWLCFFKTLLGVTKYRIKNMQYIIFAPIRKWQKAHFIVSTVFHRKVPNIFRFYSAYNYSLSICSHQQILFIALCSRIPWNSLKFVEDIIIHPDGCLHVSWIHFKRTGAWTVKGFDYGVEGLMEFPINCSIFEIVRALFRHANKL